MVETENFSISKNISIYGQTFDVTGGDLVLDDNNSIVMISERDTVVQSATRIIDTPLGDNFLHLEFGLDIEQFFDNRDELFYDDQLSFLEQLIRQALIQNDDRISQILNVKMTRDTNEPRKLNVDVTVELIDETRIEIPTEFLIR